MSFQQLRDAYGEIADLSAAASVLSWDQQTYMPPRGFAARAQQLSTLSGIIHERMTSPRLGQLLDTALASEARSGLDRAYLKELEFQRSRAMKLPAALVKALAMQESRAFESWQRAKKAKKFSIFAPDLKAMVRLLREKAKCFGYEGGTAWDALAQDYERGTNAAMVREFFEPLRLETVSLLDRIRGSQHQLDDTCLKQKWDVTRQREFVTRVLGDMGLDMAAGRIDTAPHPFCTSFGPGDVRVTTRFAPDNLMDALGSAVHEMGHALYDLGFAAEDFRTPLANAPSLGIHESQSRLWEVRIGQSGPFWQYYLPVLNQYFPAQLDGVSPQEIYRAVNRIEPGFIRVDADEISYNLHIIIRFDLEVMILAGDLDVEDIPAAWNASYKSDLGLVVPDDSLGCLQDVHWAYGSFGYFPSYTFGNIYSAMLMEKVEADLPDLWKQVSQGNAAELLEWLRENVHRHGARMGAMELIRQATGAEPSAGALIRHLNRKYSDLYGFSS